MLGQYLNLEVKEAMLKFEIRNVIVTYLVDDAILGEVAFDLAKTLGLILYKWEKNHIKWKKKQLQKRNTRNDKIKRNRNRRKTRSWRNVNAIKQIEQDEFEDTKWGNQKQ